MTATLHESISALMDNEASELEAHRVFSEINTNDELKDTWKRYQITSLVIKGQLSNKADFDISKSVAQAIANDPVYAQKPIQKHRHNSKLIRTFSSVAIAASVAFLVVFSTLQINQSNTIDSSVVSVKPTNTTIIIPTNSLANNDNDIIVNKKSPSLDQQNIQKFMDNHTQQVNLSRSRGFMPYVQLVDTEPQR